MCLVWLLFLVAVVNAVYFLGHATAVVIIADFLACIYCYWINFNNFLKPKVTQKTIAAIIQKVYNLRFCCFVKYLLKLMLLKYFCHHFLVLRKDLLTETRDARESISEIVLASVTNVEILYSVSIGKCYLFNFLMFTKN